MATIDIIHDDLYKEIRLFLVDLFDTKNIVKPIQNGVPLPENAIVMNIIGEHDFDVAVTRYFKDQNEASVQQSVEVTMQIDIYGEDSAKRSRILTNLWRNHYSTDRLKNCQPLYSRAPIHAPFINEKSMYEDRYIVELKLQYNPIVTHAQDFVDSIDITLINT